MVYKNLCVLALWTIVASALEGLTHSCLEIFGMSVVWTCHTFENNFGMKHDSPEYLNERCKKNSHEQLSMKIFSKFSFFTEISAKQSGGLGCYEHERVNLVDLNVLFNPFISKAHRRSGYRRSNTYGDFTISFSNIFQIFL